jgi:hypothetical protein
MGGHSYRIDWSQQVNIDTSGGVDASATIPSDPNPTFAGLSYWKMIVAKVPHNINAGAAATAAMAQVLPSLDYEPAFIAAGTVIHALAEGATPGAKVSFVRCYP